MRNRNEQVMALVVAAVWMMAPVVPAQEEDGGKKGPAHLFQTSDVIHPLVAELPRPDFHPGLETEKMAIYTSSKEAQRHVLEGMALLQAAWDAEAYRHFCEAVKLDPDCVMAYWGIGLALAAPNHEFSAQRMAAVDRMLDLLQALDDKLPEIERAYALSLALLFSANAREAAGAFKVLAEKFPGNLQARLLGIYMQRDGYTEFGDALYGQEQAIAEMRELLVEHPDSLAVLTFWLMLHAEAPDPDGRLRDEILPAARKLVRLCPDFPPYEHLLGHFEWRSGNPGLAEKAFTRSSGLFATYMEKNGLSFHDCPGWLRSRLYLAAALHTQGKFDEAMEVADELAVLQVDGGERVEEVVEGRKVVRFEGGRLGSAGANLVVWEARTLPARLYIARGKAGDPERGIATLPGKDDPQLFKERTLSIFYLEGLRQYLGGCDAIAAGDLEKAGYFQDALTATGKAMLRLQRNAMLSSSISEYLRALKTLEVHSAELRGKLAMAGDAGQRRGAFNWFSSAVDRQMRPSMMMPPPILYPMENRLAEYFMATGNSLRAAETYQKALLRRPNDLETLKGYQQSLLKLDRRLDAAAIQKQIDRVLGKKTW